MLQNFSQIGIFGGTAFRPSTLGRGGTRPSTDSGKSSDAFNIVENYRISLCFMCFFVANIN